MSEQMESKPWLTEPDFAKWRDPATGLLCAIRRHKDMKFLCGYVRLPHGKLRQQLIRFHQVPGKTNFSSLGHSKLKGIEVHWGLTFAGFLCSGYTRDYRLERGYWVGFDCAHAYDFVPGMYELLNSLGIEHFNHAIQDRYRDFAYVKNQVTGVARQLAKIVKK